MEKFIVAKKIGMSQVFDGQGNAVPVTIVGAGPMTVIRKKTPEKDGYTALVFGLGVYRVRSI